MISKTFFFTFRSSTFIQRLMFNLEKTSLRPTNKFDGNWLMYHHIIKTFGILKISVPHHSEAGEYIINIGVHVVVVVYTSTYVLFSTIYSKIVPVLHCTIGNLSTFWEQSESCARIIATAAGHLSNFYPTRSAQPCGL